MIRNIILSLIAPSSLCIIYFLSAGKIDMIIPWNFFTLYTLNFIVMPIIKNDKELMKERFNKKKDIKEWDIIFNRLFSFLLICLYCFSGLDYGRLNLSFKSELFLQITFLIFWIFTILISDITFYVNAYYSRFVRIQKDRDHKVIDKGPYKIVRHPGYSSSMFGIFCVPIILGSYSGLFISFLIALVIIYRTQKEDSTLINELHGYKEYCKKVKFKLIPGVW